MVALQINNNDIFDSISSITNFSVFNAVWKRYVKFALPKINKAIELIENDIPNLNLLSPQEAQLQLKEFEPLVVYLLKFKEDMKTINEKDKQEFFDKSLKLIDVIEKSVEILEDIAEPNHYYKLFCQSSSQDDWNDPLNDHWDNY